MLIKTIHVTTILLYCFKTVVGVVVAGWYGMALLLIGLICQNCTKNCWGLLCCAT